MIVSVIIENGIRKPNIDESIYLGWSVIQDFGDTMEVEVTKRPEIIANENEALKASSQLLIAERLLNESLPLERVDEFKAIFDEPKEGKVYKLDWVLVDPTSKELYKVAQPQLLPYTKEWNDFSKFPALFAPFRSKDNIQPWVQPQGAHDAYDVGIRATHKGFTWESNQKNNVWEPGVFGWAKV